MTKMECLFSLSYLCDYNRLVTGGPGRREEDQSTHGEKKSGNEYTRIDMVLEEGRRVSEVTTISIVGFDVDISEVLRERTKGLFCIY